MSLRKIILPSLAASLVMASSAHVKIYTLEATASQNSFKLQSRSAVEYKNYYLEADKIVYDKKNGFVKLYGHIFMLDGEKYSALSDFAILDLKTDHIYAKPFFFSENGTNIWIKGSEYSADRKKIVAKNAFTSSCDSRCSDWKIYFEKGIYDKEKDWVDLYHAKLYIGNFPILYTPYLSFSTNKKRRSGLLRPVFGISKEQGFTYIQPIYIAPQKWWDIEFDPQIRTKRGYGLYTTYRVANDKDAYGEVTAGIFQEKKSYRIQNNLKNDKHYGLELFYKDESLFVQPDDSHKDGLFIDWKAYNDVDYFNLKEQQNQYVSVSTLVISRLNYYYNLDNHYFGIYAKYFKDNTKVSNADTLQLLPALHYHHYTTSLIPHIYYNANFRINNFYRQEGLNATEMQLNFPITWYTRFWDDYFGISVSEQLFGNYTFYTNESATQDYDKSYTFRNEHKISVFSDLIKPYSTGTHTLHFNASLYLPSFEKNGGTKADFINIGQTHKRLELSMKEYFYDLEGSEILYHYISQPINYNEPQKLQNLENEIGLHIRKNWYLYTDIFYSHQYSDLDSISSTVSYQDEKYRLFLSHLYKKGRENRDESNYIQFSGSKHLSKKHQLFATINYDIKKSVTNSWSLGWLMQKNCWNMKLSYKRETLPLLSNKGVDYYHINSFYIQFMLYPLGGFSQRFTQSDLKGNI
ncbi:MULTISPECIES: LPS-assembly protein LptD [unclassified Nitratiruptor]|uniref:LPS-assembly protein LptD n=1 Tax=unclassified Nitratiruptor TaxID=2624044 RepID=UPI001916B4A9|nr:MULTISPECIES: LPS-assembly protein LptD [unclassified Nitratiruptor]